MYNDPYRFNLNLPRKLYDRLREEAKKQHRTVTQQIIHTLEKEMEGINEPAKPSESA